MWGRSLSIRIALSWAWHRELYEIYPRAVQRHLQVPTATSGATHAIWLSVPKTRSKRLQRKQRLRKLIGKATKHIEYA